MPVPTADQLEVWTAAVLVSTGMPRTAAATVARHLLDADRTGHSTHGLNLLPDYAEALRSGRAVADAEPTAVEVGACWVQVDGRDALGAVVLDWTTELVMQRAREQGHCMATIRRCGHGGRLGGFVEHAAREGLVMLLIAGTCGDPSDAVAAAPDVPIAQTGTNPIAVGVPADGAPFVYDSALTVVTYYEAVRAAHAGTRLPVGSVRDAAGAASDDPAAFFAGGTLAPIGGHKGFGLALAVALLCGLGGEHDASSGSIGGHFMLAIDPARALPGFQSAVDNALAALRKTPTRDGRSPHVPGDRARARRGATHQDLVIAEPVWHRLQHVADAVGVPLPEPAR